MAVFPWLKDQPSAVWIHSATYNPLFSVLFHEMGHALGLLHTFEGADCSEKPECAENCDRTYADHQGTRTYALY